MNNNYESETYFIYIPEFDKEDDSIDNDDMMAYCQGRWFKQEKKFLGSRYNDLRRKIFYPFGKTLRELPVH